MPRLQVLSQGTPRETLGELALHADSAFSIMLVHEKHISVEGENMLRNEYACQEIGGYSVHPCMCLCEGKVQCDMSGRACSSSC